MAGGRAWVFGGLALLAVAVVSIAVVRALRADNPTSSVKNGVNPSGVIPQGHDATGRPDKDVALACWPDWGSPPQDSTDQAESWPQLPQAKGWASFEGQSRRDLLAAGHGLLVSSVENEDSTASTLTAQSLADGSQQWQTDLPGFENWGVLPCFFTSKALFVPKGYRSPEVALVALDPASGKVLWTAPGAVLMSAGEAGVWVCHFNSAYFGSDSSHSEVGDDLQLLDSTTGKPLQDIKLGPLFGYATQIPVDGQTMAVATKTELVVAHSDGKVQRAARPHSGWQAFLCLDQTGLLDIGCAPQASEAELKAEDEKLRRSGMDAKAQEEAMNDSAVGQAMSGVEARLYSLPGFKPQWTTKWTDWFLRDAGNPYIYLGDKTVAICGSEDIQAIDRGSGARKQAFKFSATMSGGSLAYPLAGRIFLQGEGYGPRGGGEGKKYRAGFLDLGTGQKIDAPDGLVPWPAVRYADGYLCYIAETQNAAEPGGQAPQSSAIVCLELDSSLHPKPGTLMQLAAPKQFTELVTAFYASPDPLKDDALMRQAVGAGQRGLAQLCAKAQANNAPQVNALVRLTAYLIAKHPDANYNPPQVPLLAALKRLGAPLAPSLSRWIDDPQLKGLSKDLTALLVDTGGPEAKAFVQRTRGLPQLARLTPPKFPLRIDGPGHSSAGGLKAAESSETVSSDGKHYVALVLPGLTSSEDIYLGIDSEGDGSFEKLLPTGLRDSVPMRGLPEPGKGQKPGPGLQLKLSLPTVEFTYRDQPSARRFAEPSTVKEHYATAKLTLAALEADSDADGLTDITETLLHTDPHNSDTNGNGIPDQVDPTPGVNPEKMGKLERGVARALAFAYSQWNEGLPPDEGPGPPFSAMFMVVQGCGPVAFSRPGMYGVCVSMSEKELSEAYEKGTLGSGDFMHLAVGNDDSANDRGLPAGQQPPWGVNISGSGSGSFVELKEIDGEYYPVREYETWIS